MDILHFIKISMQMSRLYKRAACRVTNVGAIKDGSSGGFLDTDCFISSRLD